MGNWYECRLISAYGIDGQFCFANATYDFHVKEEFESVEFPAQESSAWHAVKMYHKNPIRGNRQRLKWGLCIPSSCTSDDLKISLTNHLKPIFKKNEISIQVDVNPITCTKKHHTVYPKQYYFFWCFLFTIITLVLSSTFYDSRSDPDKENSLCWKLFQSFSLNRNVKYLAKPVPLVQRAAHATKSLVTGVALYAHLVLYVLGYPKHNEERSELRYESVPFDLGHSALTDIFFVISGYLAFDFGIVEVHRGGAFNLLLNFITRWIRMIVPLGVMIYFVTYVVPYLGDGPLWNYYIQREVDNCRENWWASIFGLANVYNVENQCILVSWYISVDLHLALIASFLLYIIYKNPKFGVLATCFVFSLGMLITFSVVYIKKLDGVFMFYMSILEDPRKSANFYFQYTATYSRVAPYLTGFIWASIAHLMKKRHYQFPLSFVRMGFFSGLIMSEIYQLYAIVFYKYGRAYNPFENAFYAATHRCVFAAPFAFGLCTVATSKIDKFLENLAKSKVGLILGRLSLSTFMINTIILLVHFSLQTDLLPATIEINLYWSAAAFALISYFMGFIFYLLVEAPVFNILKVIMGNMKITQKPQQKPKTEENGFNCAEKDVEECKNGVVNESFTDSNASGRIDSNTSTNL